MLKQVYEIPACRNYLNDIEKRTIEFVKVISKRPQRSLSKREARTKKKSRLCIHKRDKNIKRKCTNLYKNLQSIILIHILRNHTREIILYHKEIYGEIEDSINCLSEDHDKEDCTVIL